MSSGGSLPSTPVGLVSSPLSSEGTSAQHSHVNNREEGGGRFTSYIDNSPQLDVLFEIAEVLVQEIDIASGVPIYPFPQPSPLIISSVAVSSPSSPAAGGASGAGSSLALLLLGNSKILLKEHEVTVIQIEKYVFDIVFMERRFSAASPNSCSSSSTPQNDNNNPSSPMSSPFRFKCVRIGMPTDVSHTEDIEAFAAITACYVGPLAVQTTEQTAVGLLGSARLVGGAPTQSFEIEVREALLTKGGGIGSHHHAMILSSSSSSGERSLVPIGGGGGGQTTTSSTSSVLASNVNYYGRLAAGYINKGTSVAVSSISKTTDVVVASTQPCQEAVRVPEVIKTGIEGGRVVAKTAADFTGGIASSLVFAANAVGSYAGSGIASALATAGGGDDGVGSEESKGWLQSSANLVRTSILPPVVEVGSAAISSGALVFSAVCDAQQNVLEATKTNLTRVVTHKLGSEVGEAAQGVMETAKLGAEVAFVGSSKKVKRAAVLMAAKVARKAAESAADSHARIEQERLTRALRPGGGGGAMAITAGVSSAPLLIEGPVSLPKATSSLPAARSSSFDSLELRTDDCGAPLKREKKETEGRGYPQPGTEEGSRGAMANNAPVASPCLEVEEITKEEVETSLPSATSRSRGHDDDYAHEVTFPPKTEGQTIQLQSTSTSDNLGVAAAAVPETISRL